MSTEPIPDGDEINTDTDTKALIDAFDRDDPALNPEEKETTFRFARDEDLVDFYTDEAGVGRRLIAHKETNLMTVVVRDGDTRRSVPPEEVEAGSDIVAVRGTIPVGALSIRSSSRKNDHHAAIVTDRVLQEVDK